MIKAEDLRIGDLVKVCGNCLFTEGSRCSVTQIYPEQTYNEKKGVVTLSYIDGTDDGPWGVWCSNIEGLILTPAILEKNGFNSKEPRKGYIKYIDDSEIKILRRYLYVERQSNGWEVSIKIKGFSDSVTIRKIQYVHELQHILWALGTDSGFEI